eukprot:TRINITY_DN36377_c0_g1_i1.p1 TRINITY_DN36377_c0_g1~~TRINITY_DN36377_c0_g1_i1.p1  ORF type:complete len:322 (+),score=86.82 TRINITY_DN36377_c0_g1_i1:55-1020(+)
MASLVLVRTRGFARRGFCVLQQSLDNLVAELRPEASPELRSRRRFPTRTRRRRAEAMREDAGSMTTSLAATMPEEAKSAAGATMTSLAVALPDEAKSAAAYWESKALALQPDPARELLIRQQEQWHVRLANDRVMQWQNKQQLMNAKLQEALQPKEDSPHVDELDPGVVQAIFDAVAADPGQEVVERRELRKVESLALQIEHMLACPPAALQRVLKSSSHQLRIIRVDAPDDPGESHAVYFDVPAGQSPSRLQRRLDRAATVLSASMAKRLLLAVAPKLHFLPAPSEADQQRKPALWHEAKTARRVTAHKAMQSWVSTMNW